MAIDGLDNHGLQFSILKNCRIGRDLIWGFPVRTLGNSVVGIGAISFAEAGLVAFLEVLVFHGNWEDCEQRLSSVHS